MINRILVLWCSFKHINDADLSDTSSRSSVQKQAKVEKKRYRDMATQFPASHFDRGVQVVPMADKDTQTTQSKVNDA
jgi:hypothetical protein